jgi:hypothetical protein
MRYTEVLSREKVRAGTTLSSGNIIMPMVRPGGFAYRRRYKGLRDTSEKESVSSSPRAYEGCPFPTSRTR